MEILLCMNTTTFLTRFHTRDPRHSDVQRVRKQSPGRYIRRLRHGGASDCADPTFKGMPAMLLTVPSLPEVTGGCQIDREATVFIDVRQSCSANPQIIYSTLVPLAWFNVVAVASHLLRTVK